MRSAIVLVGAFASVAFAQIPGLATCAGACLGNGFGGCNRLDVKCICSNKELLSELSCCVLYNCNEADQKSTIQFANAICAGQGVTDLPQAASCAPGQQPTGAAGATVSVTRIPSNTAAPTSSPTAGSSSSNTSSNASNASNNTATTTTAAAPAAATSSTSPQRAAAATQAPLYGLGGLLAGAGLLVAGL